MSLEAAEDKNIKKEDKGKFYITTPIYYPSGKLTIGNAYTTLLADAYARYERLRGKDVCFLTGTDEHGKKIQEKAAEEGQDPQSYVDARIAEIRELWDLMNISYDRFIRTTDDCHVAGVREVYRRLYEQGDIYKGHYKGLYCIPCETWFTATQAEEGMCPDCSRELRETEESCYFFRLSKYTDRLLKYFEEHPDYLQPAHRAKELIKNFIEPGLEDLAVSRSTFDWGVPLPFDEEHIAYVWIDALSNYFTALGWPMSEQLAAAEAAKSGSETGVQTGALTEGAQAQAADEIKPEYALGSAGTGVMQSEFDDSGAFERFWTPDLQLLGKDILRFHGIVWPILLMALGLEQPKCLYAHGWLLNRGDKMSKSKGNSMDPVEISKIIPVDGIRYFVLSELGHGEDGNYDPEQMVLRCNSFMANDLGNLLSRTTAMIRQNFPNGFFPHTQASYLAALPATENTAPASGSEQGEATAAEQATAEAMERVREIKALYLKEHESFVERMAALNLPKALESLSEILSACNHFIDETKPWVLAKSEEAQDKRDLALYLYTLADLLYNVAILVEPFVPDTAVKFMEALGFAEKFRAPAEASTIAQAPTKATPAAPTSAATPIDKQLRQKSKSFHHAFSFAETLEFGHIKTEQAFEEYPAVYARLKKDEAVKALQNIRS